MAILSDATHFYSRPLPLHSCIRFRSVALVVWSVGLYASIGPPSDLSELFLCLVSIISKVKKSICIYFYYLSSLKKCQLTFNLSEDNMYLQILIFVVTLVFFYVRRKGQVNRLYTMEKGWFPWTKYLFLYIYVTIWLIQNNLFVFFL